MTDDELIALADHIDDFADAMPSLAVQGRYWWFRPSDNTFHATDSRDSTPGDLYLLDASPQWQQQWAGNWEAAALHLMDALDAEMNRPVTEGQ
ncbi:hypothetical protein [Mycobacterium sp. SMC-4]|uniref:hypothetical protein n=1 Tax=Mycobacterium sp. SMC-4 TaxID=2857059 RepID=UPI0021B4C2FB|nr:hypothetical protein [Mycobacterium sp. SMC-4]UXA19561.1 hypothetical protein KXD98_08165 [Mycobacterium sp. SMC-4]